MTVVRGRLVLITGAGSGIGYESARSFVTRGANLVLADINATALEKDDTYLFTGPTAKAGYFLMRLARRLARRLTISGARKSGFLKLQGESS